MRDRAETGEAVEEAEFEKVADAEVREGADAGREAVVLAYRLRTAEQGLS